MNAQERRLTDYVIAKSSSRMFERMDTSYSKDLFEVLQMVKDEDVRNTTLPFADLLRKSQLHRDKKFLDTIHSLPGQKYMKSIMLTMPSLLKLSQSLEDRFTMFYTAEIAVEIQIFVRLTLQDIRDSVERIHRKRYAGAKGRKSQAHHPQNNLAELTSLVARVSFASHLLRLFVYSSAASAHFTAIQPILEKYRAARLAEKRKRMKSKTTRKGTGSSASKPHYSDEQNVAVVDDIEEELGEDFGEVDEDEDELTAANTEQVDREKSRFPIVSLYLQWIRRLVSHTEAINTLCQMGRQMAALLEPPTLSVQVLTVAHTGEKLKPWEDIIHSVWTSGGDASSTPEEVIDQLHEQQLMKKGEPLLF